MNSEREIYSNGAIAINEDRIIAVGNNDAITSSYDAPDTIDANGYMIIPGFIDGHNHPSTYLIGGLADEIDIRHMRFKNRNPHFNFTQNAFQPHVFPKAVLILDTWNNWPQQGLSVDTPETLTGAGTFSFHGITRPVELPVILTLSTYLGGTPLETPVLSATMTLPFNPSEYGVKPPATWRKIFDRCELRLTLTGRPCSRRSRFRCRTFPRWCARCSPRPRYRSSS